MDLQPLYEVQERLEHAAVAGTGILNEDFRLRRAREGLAPLAAASPVFAKISAGLDALLSAPAEKRGGALLDVLALVDAVAYTQASAGMAGALEPLPPGTGACRQVSYGQLRPLLEALTGAGGGRMAVVQEAFQAHPEYFSDYRVLPALVSGLGDSYGELADLNAAILSGQGADILPLLEAGFDPAGGRAMARRVEVMAQTAGGEANGFFLAQFPQAKKEVRMALIAALACDPSNGAMLLELCRTERKGAARDLAHQALARLDIPEGEAYLAEQAEQDPDKLLELLQGVSSRTASRITARLFEETLDRMEDDPEAVLPQETWRRLRVLCQTLEGKEGPEIQALFRRLAGLTERQLDRQAEGERGKPERLRFSCFDVEPLGSFRLRAALALCRTIVSGGDRALCRMAMELQDRAGEDFLAPALAARLLTQAPADSYAWAERQLLKTGLLGARVRQEAIRPFRHVLCSLCWDGQEEVYRWAVGAAHAASLAAIPPLDTRWFSLLARAGGGLDGALLNLLEGRRLPDLAGEVLDYLYRAALKSRYYGQVQQIVRILTESGWTDWGGFAVRWVGKNSGGPAQWEIMSLLEQLPVPPEEKAEQLRELDRLIKEKRLKVQRGYWPVSGVERHLEKWKQEALRRGEEGHG